MRDIHSRCILSVFFLLTLGCGKKEGAAVITSRPTVVDIAEVRRIQPSLPVVLPGELKAWNRTTIVAKVKGYVGTVNADRGTRVKKGQLLATLEAPEIVAELNQAKAHVASAEAGVIEQTAKQRASTMTYRRIVETSKTEGAVSANELEVAYARMTSDSALARAAQQNLEAARARFVSQQQRVQYLQVRAPFDGIITERDVSPGDLVGDTRPLFLLEDRSRLRVTVAIPENLSNSLDENSTITFTVQAVPDKTYHATFARSANTLEERNRSMLAEFDFVNAEEQLKAGMYAEVRLPIMRSEATLFVPATSLIHSTEGVFLVRVDNETAAWVAVQKGNSLDSLVEVFGPVKEGEKIVKFASEELRNGQPLTLK